MSKAKGIMIEIIDIEYSRGKKNILADISIKVETKKITAIMGPSGCGKTTLLKIIGGMLCPQSGEILIDGVNIFKLKRSELYDIRKKMTMLFQSGALFSNLNVFDNVAFPLREHTNLPESIIKNLVLIKLEAVGLRGAQNLMVTELSGGMSRRVAIARAIVMDPKIIMYDEPFTGQDPITKGVLLKLVKMLNVELEMTCIVVSHDIEEVCRVADMIYILASGRVIASGTPAEIMKSKKSEVRQFIFGNPDGTVPFHYPTNKSLLEESLEEQN